MKHILYKHLSQCWYGFVVLFAFLLPIVTNANHGGDLGGLQNPLAFHSLDEFLKAILDIIILIGWPIVVVAVVWTGFKFVTAQGSTDKLTEAKRAFMWTVIGALVVLGAQAIALLVGGTVGELRG